MGQEFHCQSVEINEKILWQLNVPLGSGAWKHMLEKTQMNRIIHQRV